MNSWAAALSLWREALATFIIIDAIFIWSLFWEGIGSTIKKKNKRKFYAWSIGIINLIAFLAAVSVILWYQPDPL